MNQKNTATCTIKVDIDARDAKHYKICVPGKRKDTFIPLSPKDYAPEVLEVLVNTPNDEPWKQEYLKELYKEYRQEQNKKNRKDCSIDVSFQEPTMNMALALHSVDRNSPEETVILRDEIQPAMSVLLDLNDMELKRYVSLCWVQGHKCMDVARQECDPDADLATVKRRGDTIRKKLSRLKDKIRKKYSD